MSATDEQVARLRRMVSEPTEDTYDDDALAEYIERYALEDARGEYPTVESEAAPGTLEENPDWTATYDMYAAAADVVEEKAAAVAVDFDFEADGGQFTRSQKFNQMMRLVRHYRSKRSPRTITLRMEPLDQGERG